ncbi:TerD family protein [Pseudonocardia abyssalis]|uniref:TerD family protein n=1 Tax=Pseudonocardia abyssalis TaxID=2792008 RepID=A0ABS6URJ7_9PSEU|nr:TerD family protein [Pseudonocardia abyssalis]MBW0114307.1 TerD family protein [Pseudonocardia abyssalis]MBW0134869.1 TerD family protein [Pseudonocardia abyssalis]
MTTARIEPLLDLDHSWAVVDVETSGFQPDTGRVLSVAALALDSAGRPERRFHTLVDAGVEPGPVHIHGLTRERLAGAPSFEQIAPELLAMLNGRILVAHNAAFDHRFLATEVERAGLRLPVERRLCTLALSRRLGLAVPNHKLGTLAGYWGVDQQHAHDALDDVQVLARILTHSLLLAARLDLPLPIVACGGNDEVSSGPARTTTPRCPWRNPGRLQPGGPLVQGMRVAVTGAVSVPREQLVDQLVVAGIDVSRSVSRLTSALVTNNAQYRTRKAERARAEGIPVIDEATLRRLLGDVRPGDPLTTATTRPAAPRIRVTTSPRGPLHDRRVLIIGGTHEQAADVRAAIAGQGGTAAVNFTAAVTDVVLMAGGEADRRLARIRETGLPVHTGSTALGISVPAPAAETAPAPVTDPDLAAYVGRHRNDAAGPGVPVVVGGEVIDLPDAGAWTVNAAWRADALAEGTEVDVVAFLLDADERVVADEDFVFYNAPVSEHGAVALSVDGDSEQSLRVDLTQLDEQHSKIVVAAALVGGATFGDLGAVALAVDGDLVTAATATLDAATTERTLLLAEIYRRDGSWRLRAIGQGYDDGLAELAARYGVVVNEG